MSDSAGSVPHPTGATSRPIFFDEAGEADEIVAALRAEGYEIHLRREVFAGEDDAEDPAWVLLVTPFDRQVVDMVDVYGGWMPEDERVTQPEPPSPPPDLPAGPRRLKGPEGRDST